MIDNRKEGGKSDFMWRWEKGRRKELNNTQLIIETEINNYTKFGRTEEFKTH